MSKSQTTIGWHRTEWVEGYACAVGTLARAGQDTLARDLMTGVGLTLCDLVHAEVGAFDLDPIRRAMQ